MVRLTSIIIGISLLFSCTQENKHAGQKLSVLLKDSTHIFSGISDFNINGEVEGCKLNIEYTSVSEEDFFTAIERSSEQVKYYSRKDKVNEGVGCSQYSRIDSLLEINIRDKKVSFFDLEESELHSARSYFLQSIIGSHYIIKRIQFEDGETMFLNSKSGDIDFRIPLINVFSNDSLLFVSDSRLITFGQNPTISLMQIRNNKLDTLLHAETNWFTHFAFFDKQEASIYYIHEKSEDNRIVSTYGKINIE